MASQFCFMRTARVNTMAAHALFRLPPHLRVRLPSAADRERAVTLGAMKASRWEFRFRFFLFALIFYLAFWLSRLEGGSLWLVLSAWASRVDRLATGTNALILGVIVSLLAAVAAGLRTWATAYLGRTVVHDLRLHAHAVVATGPYAYVRHPLYLATILLAVAMAPMLSPWAALGEVALITLVVLRLIGREETELAAARGEDYQRFKAAVPSLWPRLRKTGVVDAGVGPRWGQAILGELWFWGLAAAIIVYAATFRFDWFLRVLAISLGFYLVLLGLRQKSVGAA